MAFDSSSMSASDSENSWSEDSSEDSYSSPSEDDDTLDSDGQRNAKTLSDLSRSVVSKNVKRENVRELPLPGPLKKEVFKNLLTDRHGSQKKIYGRGSFPCEWDCSSFSYKTRKSEWNKFPFWSLRSLSDCGAHLLYDRRAFPSNAPWLKLPDRERLLEDLKGTDDERIALLNTLRFDRRSGLGKVHVWLKRFVYYKSEYDWFYVVVAAGCMDSFVQVAQRAELVALPYSCVSDHGVGFGTAEIFRIRFHRRCMIVVVRNGKLFLDLLYDHVEFAVPIYSTFRCYRCTRISKVTDLVKAIAHVSTPKRADSTRYGEPSEFDDGFPETHYYIANPVVRHAEWWMLLMAGGFDDLVRNRLQSKGQKNLSFGERIEGRRRVSAAVELRVENCAVRFDPPDTCIGDPVPENELLDYLRGGKPFAFGFDRRILSTFRTDECPTDLPAYKEWCVSNETNTLLHFDRNDIVEYKRRKKGADYSEKLSEKLFRHILKHPLSFWSARAIWNARA